MYHNPLTIHFDSQTHKPLNFFSITNFPRSHSYLFHPNYPELSSKQSLADGRMTFLFGSFISTDLITLLLPWHTFLTLPRGKRKRVKWSSFIEATSDTVVVMVHIL